MVHCKKLKCFFIYALIFAILLCGCKTKGTPSPSELCKNIVDDNNLSDLTLLSGDKLESYFGFNNSDIKRFSVMISDTSEKSDTIAVFEVQNNEEKSLVISGISKYTSSLADSMQLVEAEHKKLSSCLIMELDGLIILIICAKPETIEQGLVELGAKAVY